MISQDYKKELGKENPSNPREIIEKGINTRGLIENWKNFRKIIKNEFINKKYRKKYL